jgi:hypothetical protein
LTVDWWSRFHALSFNVFPPFSARPPKNHVFPRKSNKSPEKPKNYKELGPHNRTKKLESEINNKIQEVIDVFIM